MQFVLCNRWFLRGSVGTMASAIPCVYAALFLSCFAAPVRAGGVDTSGGRVAAVPTPGAVKVDGDLREWDLSGLEEVTLDVKDANALQAAYAVMHDQERLYLAVKVTDPTPLRNLYTPLEPFWRGDAVQFRIGVDPSLPRPLPPRGEGLSPEFRPRVAWISAWRNHVEGKDYLHVYRGDATPTAVNPPGSAVAFQTWADGKGYTLEWALPWTAMGVETAPATGSVLPGLLEVLWADSEGGEPSLRAVAVYQAHPGMFGFSNWHQWGDVALRPSGRITRPEHRSLAQLRAAQEATVIPIRLKLKRPAAVSVNLYNAAGQIIREILRETPQPAGQLTLSWEGRDFAGHLVTPGTYRWKAIAFSPPRARYIGGVGSSGDPPYDTPDGRGAWGSDHCDPLDVVADETGMYFLWYLAEWGRSLVKTDLEGHTLWRKSPAARNHWGDFTSVAAEDGRVYVLAGDRLEPELLRLKASDGGYLPYSASRLGASIAAAKASEGSTVPAASGLAVRSGKGYVSLYYENRLAIVNLDDGAEVGRLEVPRPRGLCFDNQGNLFVLSCAEGQPTAKVLQFTQAQGEPVEVVRSDLRDPVDVAVLNNGDLVVTDAGPESNQVKRFSPEGRLLAARGKAGGRPWSGAYEAENFLRPWGVGARPDGGFVVAENSPPRVITWFAPDGKVVKRWFGPGTYGTTVWPDPADPFTLYWTVRDAARPQNDGSAIARATIDPKTEDWSGPLAYWCFRKSDYPAPFGTFGNTSASVPDIVSVGGRRFLYSPFPTFSILRIEGDRMIPVAALEVVEAKQQPRQARLARYGGMEAAPRDYPLLPAPTTLFGFGVDDHLNLYYESARRIVKVPCLGVDPAGIPQWDERNFRVVVDNYCPGIADRDLANEWRRCLRGIRTDSKGNLYVAWCAGPESSGPHWSAHITWARVAKYTPEGKLIWVAGNKAMAPRREGEIYNIWVLAGVLHDRYVALGDETGLIHFYTSDGFYRGRLFNDLAQNPPPGPETFSGETFSGRVLYEARTRKYYAYQGATAGLMFEVEGLGKEESLGEGTVRVSPENVAQQIPDAAAATAGAISEVASGFWIDAPAEQWGALHPFTLLQGGRALATVWTAYNDEALFARFDVTDETPLLNSADDPETGFIGGDAVSLYLGPPGARTLPTTGDLRILVVPGRTKGAVTLIGMKPKTGGDKRPRTYRSPGQSAAFEWVGAVPGATARAESFAGGYRIVFSIPRRFLEGLKLAPGEKVRFEAEVMFSDAAGTKTSSRYFLFGRGSRVSMVNDVPTQAQLYPELWQEVELRQNPAKSAALTDYHPFTHASVEEHFDNAAAIFLEAEAAEYRSRGLWVHRWAGQPAILIDNAGLDEPVEAAWKLPPPVRAGSYRCYVSWSQGGHSSGAHALLLGPDRDHFRAAGRAAGRNRSYQLTWQRSAAPLEVLAGDSWLGVRFEPGHRAPNHDYRLDAVALLPQ